MVQYLFCPTLKTCIGAMNKYLARNKAYERQAPTKEAKKLYVISEGSEKEYYYFLYFRELSSNIDIIPIPSKNGKTDPVKLKEQACALFKGASPKYLLDESQGDEIWFVIDTDKWNEGDKISILRDFCNVENSNSTSKRTVWNVAQSNPCFEIWQYYHFFKSKPNQPDVDRFDSFKAFTDDAIKGGFDNRKHPCLIGSAIANSEKNFTQTDRQPTLFSTELHELGKVIYTFVGDAIKHILENTR